MKILGIDPGISGGAAVVDIALDEIVSVEAIDLPTTGEKAKRRIDAVALRSWILSHNGDGRIHYAIIERAQAMPQQGASSGFLYGRAVGALEAVVACCGIPLTIVEPTAWKKHFGLLKSDKENSRQRAIHLMPQWADQFRLRYHHGRAEAALMALYGGTRTYER